jgi:glutathione S-transferase
MITLYGFGPAFGLPDASPFVMKAEMLLKLANLPYRKDTAGFRKAPKGKLPYIEDEGQVVADSTFIRWHLEKKYGVDFDAGLSAAERGAAWAVEKLLEDNLYWAALQWRWLDDANFARGPAVFFKAIPWPLQPVIASAVRRKVRQSLRAHGLGRHTPDEQARIASKTFDSLAAMLGDKPYLMGDQASAADAALFAFMASVLCPHFETPLRTAAQAHLNLVQYVKKMQGHYFPEQAPPVA